MTNQEIDAVFDRVRSWPKDRQAYAAALLLELEREQEEPYQLSPEEEAALDDALAAADRGEFATDEEVEAVFARYRS